MSSITIQVLDTSRGRPAPGLSIRLEQCHEGAPPEVLGRGTTDMEGRVRNLLPPGAGTAVGRYRLVGDTATYYQEMGVAADFPEVSVTFEVREAGRSHHLALMVSPGGFAVGHG